MKPTRTDNNKPSQSTPIRKGKLSPEVIKRTAEELTKNQMCDQSKGLTTTGSAIKTYKSIVEVEAPKIEPIVGANIKPAATPGNYKVFAETLKAVIDETGQFEVTGDQLKLFFPQRHYGGQVAMHLKRYYGLSYRRVENGRNDTYVFFVEPTREELLVQLTSAESKVIWSEQEKNILKNKTYTLEKENTQLKSDLSNSQRSNNILLRFAIGAVITIIFKSVAL